MVPPLSTFAFAFTLASMGKGTLLTSRAQMPWEMLMTAVAVVAVVATVVAAVAATAAAPVEVGYGRGVHLRCPCP